MPSDRELVAAVNAALPDVERGCARLQMGTAHYADIRIRSGGEYVWHEGDWCKSVPQLIAAYKVLRARLDRLIPLLDRLTGSRGYDIEAEREARALVEAWEKEHP